MHCVCDRQSFSALALCGRETTENNLIVNCPCTWITLLIVKNWSTPLVITETLQNVKVFYNLNKRNPLFITELSYQQQRRTKHRNSEKKNILTTSIFSYQYSILFLQFFFHKPSFSGSRLFGIGSVR